MQTSTALLKTPVEHRLARIHDHFLFSFLDSIYKTNKYIETANYDSQRAESCSTKIMSSYASGFKRHRTNMRLKEDYTSELSDKNSQQFRAIETRIKNAVCDFNKIFFLRPRKIFLY